ncbi:ERF family protein [Paenibacillus apis]|uniref:Single-stranded DNA-binding protein n=1 Tax=Paenibacillus apis TaxID=1792174 RepID=A0A919Y395_9BACL|nr:ERF family protein [Paenibacillus apis]GIO42518.1 single-stranded DNA-binding protein [Paenibacillus apis]
MIFSESNQSISKALVDAWGAIETPKHNTNVTVKLKTGGSYEFSYTDLEGIFDALKTVYKENRIAVLQTPKTFIQDGSLMVSVETMLLHDSGEWIKSEPLSVTASNNMQDLGGQITYMKRYSLSAISGISTEKDDDANGVSGNQVEYKGRQEKRSDAQVKRLFAIANSKDISAADVKKALMKDYNKTNAEDLTKQEYDELCNRLELAEKGHKHAE